MGDMNEKLGDVKKAFAEMKQYYDERGKIDSELSAELLNKMKEFEGTEAELQEMEEAINKLNEANDVSSASAIGSLFAGVRRAFSLFLQNPNVRSFGRRAVEEMYSNVAEDMLDRTRQSSATQQATESSGQALKSECSSEKSEKKFD